MINRIIAMVLMVTIIAACKPTDPTAAKKAKLEQLKKEVQAKQQEIAALEKEMKVVPDAGAANKSTVSVVQTKDTVFKHYIVVQGKIESDQNIWLTPKVPGAAITSLNVKRGDKVSKGQVLATLESGTVSNSMDEVKNSLDLATTVYQKQKNLWDQKIGSEIQYLTAKNNKDAMEKRLATMREQLSMYTLRSPITGTVDDLTLKLGEIPTPGLGGIRVVDYSKAKVTADISENYTGKIKVGDQILLHYPDINKDVTSKVRTVSRVIDASARTFKMEAEPGPTADLHPNMIAIVKINDYTNSKARVIQVNVIQNDEKGPFVYVIEKTGNQNIARKKPVTVGQNFDGLTEITSGISDNDMIISSGYQNVVDGQPVNL
jgi:RND family efflux transporter MFP subunit